MTEHHWTVVIGAIAPLAFWALYATVLRPGLAKAMARPVVFWLVFLACTVTVTAAILRAGLVAAVWASLFAVSVAESLALVLGYALVASSAVAVAAALAPGVVVRALGGPDPTIPRRYALDVFGARWRRAASHLPTEDAALRDLARSLPADDLGSTIAEWMTTHNTTRDTDVTWFRSRIQRLLADNAPFDPISWFRTTRWR